VQPVELLCDRPWGLRDFRVVDPDGYYLRITHT
jgi:lactoylglutathione lyase